MTTSTAVSPFVVSDIVEVELTDDRGKRKLWKKQILPAGTKQYKGKELDFSKINPAVVQAFDDKAFDAVPFVMSLTDNEHPKPGQEADQLEGDLDKLELGSDGSLFGYFDLSQSPRVVKIIKKSKGKFGVSGRIEVDYTAEDSGKHYEYALSHVCGTTRPHIKGMAGWEPVDLSEEEKDRPVIDFSAEIIEEKGMTKPSGEGEGGGGSDLMSKLTDKQIEKLLALANDLDDIEKSADDIEKEGETSKEVVLPESAKEQIAAAEEQGRRALELAERMQVDASRARWEAERKVLLSEGVPPVLLDKAGKILSRHRSVSLEFAEGDVVDATEIVREILEECKGVIKLGDELGHSFSDSDRQEDSAYKKLEESFMASWNNDGRNG